MAFTTTAKLSEVMPLRNTLPLSSHSPSLNFNFIFSSPKPSSFSLLKPFSSSLRTTERSSSNNNNHNHNSNNRYSSPRTHPNNNNSSSSKNSRYPWVDEKNPRKPTNPSTKSRDSTSSWINKWPSPNPPPIESPDRKFVDLNGDDKVETRYFDGGKGGNGGRTAIERIVLRLRSLGLGSEDDEKEEEDDGKGLDGREDAMQVTAEEKLGDLLMRDWMRPDTMLVEDDGDDETVLPWERGEDKVEVVVKDGKLKERPVKASSLAELTIEETELKRLRRIGMGIKDKINVAKAGVTQAVVEKIHDRWRKEELVRLKFHESLAHDMRTGHELVERRTGGLVIWRAGSVMVVFRGSNYQGPSRTQPASGEGDVIFVPDASSAENTLKGDISDSGSTLQKSMPAVANLNYADSITAEEAEFNKLLDGLGPRFVDWWGTGVLPVDADLLALTIPGYKPPFRLLATGMRSRLTNAEMTDLRKVAKSLPIHFALGRNRNHQGLAAAIVKLWEKSVVVKIAVKRGIQNTNNKLMAEEIRDLTGGVLLLRNKFYIVIYRGKDFLPTSVAAALAEREELTKEIQNVEEKVRSPTTEAAPSGVAEGQPLAGTLAEFYEAQARWGKEISAEEHEKMVEEASRAKSARVVKRNEHKLGLAQAKKLRAERLLGKIEVSMVPVGPCDDLETITDEERFVFRRIGLSMKAYLPLGIRGVFDGVIENMHLHWKHRELVKLISKQKTLAFVEDTARLLEYESGGILVAIERVSKGYALIYYRGKNYRRPISIRPRNLLTKAKALKRSVAMQRHEALSQHISELQQNIEQLKLEVGDSTDVGDVNTWSSEDPGQFDHVSEFTQSEDEASLSDSDGDDEEDPDWDDDEDSDASGLENDDHTSKNKG